MSSVLVWPVVLTLAAGVGTLYLVTYLFQYRDKPGATWFIVTLLGQATFCFAYGIALTVFDPTLRYWLEILALLGLVWLAVPFLGFALGYTGRGALLDSWVFRGLLFFPVVSTVLLPLNHVHGLFLTDFEVTRALGVAGASYTFGPVMFVGCSVAPSWSGWAPCCCSIRSTAIRTALSG